MNVKANPPHTGDSDIVNAIASMREAGLHDLSICEALRLDPRYLSTLSAGRPRRAYGVTDDATGAHTRKERSRSWQLER